MAIHSEIDFASRFSRRHHEASRLCDLTSIWKESEAKFYDFTKLWGEFGMAFTYEGNFGAALGLRLAKEKAPRSLPTCPDPRGRLVARPVRQKGNGRAKARARRPVLKVLRQKTGNPWRGQNTRVPGSGDSLQVEGREGSIPQICSYL